MKKHKKVHTKPIKKGVAKVPMVVQLEALECGAASLTMIMAYYGKWLPLEQVRADCGVSRDGSNARNVLNAARYYGLKAKGYKFEPENLRKHGKFPCIIHWNFNHFVVLDGFRGNRAYINDPGGGTYSVSMEEFDEAFTGVTLMFEPTEEFVPDGHKKSILKYILKRSKGLGAAVALVALSSAVFSISGVISPIFGRVFLDRILTGINPEWITPFLFGLAGLFLIQIVSEIISGISAYRIGGKLAASGNLSFMWKVLHLPMRFYSQRMAGDVLDRQSTNADVSDILVNTLAPLVLDIIMMLFYLIVMIRFSLILTLIGVLSVVINSVVSYFVTQKRVNVSRVAARDEGKLSACTVSGIRMMETIKSSGAEEGFFEMWAGYAANSNVRKVEQIRLNEYYGSIPGFISSIAGLLILAVGVYLAMTGDFTLGMISAFQGLFMSFSAPVDNLITAGETIQEMRTLMERIEDVMNYPDDPAFSENVAALESSDDETSEKAEEVTGEEKEYDKLHGNIELRNVTFGYSPLEDPLIEDFSMSIKAGQRVAFVGTSGCGKSTLSRLISGLYQPWEGEILFDGKPMNTIDKNEFKSSVAVVDQDIVLFEDSIANNIKMWDESIEDFDMILAARDAQIHNDIMDRPEGYSYKLIEGGRNLSGGQRQRLEIARVLAQDPTVIILDEATSALDAKTEYDVVKSIKDRGITCIVVAHRLSTIRDCDEIIVLDHGIVQERGTHRELMEQDGLYASLVTDD